LIGAEQQLLTGLAARVKGPGNECAAERAVIQQPSVLARERNTLRDALIDDVVAHLREAIDIGFAGTEVAAFNGVVEQPVDAVAVVGVIFRRVDAALCGDRVRPARAVLKAEALHAVSQLGQRSRRGCAGQP